MAQELSEPARSRAGGALDRRRPHLGWAAWSILFVGITASVVGAIAWGSYQRSQGHAQFQTATNSAAATLSLTLARDVNVMATTRTLVTTQPDLDNGAFGQWFSVLGASSRYPGGFDFSFVSRVPAAGVPGFEQTVDADPPYGTPVAPFVVAPPGTRPYYCFLRLTVMNFPDSVEKIVANDTSQLKVLENPGFDECSTAIETSFHSSAVSTDLSTANMSTVLDQLGLTKPYLPGKILKALGGYEPFVMILPVYQGSTTPATPAARQARLAGWVEGIFASNQVLAPALQALHGGSLELSYRNAEGPATVLDRIGTTPSSPFTRTIELQAGGTWTLTVSSPSAAWSAKPSPMAQGIIVLVIGLLFSFMLFLLVGLLTNSRAMALEMVDEKTEELRYQALHDSLTGLPNRWLILDHTGRLLARARRDHTAVSLLFVDLDGFKDVNDTLGHRVGDDLLRAVSSRIADALREADTVGRLGGDEFVVLADVSDPEGAAVLAQRLISALDEPFTLESHLGPPIRVTASIGVATGIRASSEDLLRDADIALYEAKGAGKNRYVIFQPRMHAELRDRQELGNDLQRAQAEGQFFLVYQPIIRLSDLHILGVEALIRWRHPDRGIVAPLDFIPQLEVSGLIVDVGRFVLAEACRQAKEWHDAGFRLGMSVNVSARQFEEPALVRDVVDVLAQTRIDPSTLVIEITETVLMHDAAANASRLNELKQVGVKVAIDDFGTGYSSMAYLQQFPVDILKIDQSFIRSMTDSHESEALVHALVQLGQALGLRSVAEGIEDSEQLALLRAEHCDSGQGYLFARPADAEQITALLQGGPIAVPQVSGPGS